jgi:exopolysaccharide biosynthesis polyprenyl glycosylphosphotransferase
MRGTRRQMVLTALKVLDVVLMSLSFLAAAVIVFHISGRVPFTQFLSMRIKVQNFILFSGLVVVWHVTFSFLGLYRSRLLATRPSHLADLVAATSVATLCTGLGKLLFTIRMVNPTFLLVLWAASTVTMLFSRLLFRYFLSRIHRGSGNVRFVLVVGTNPRAVAFAQKLESKPEYGYRIIGFADNAWSGLEEFRRTKYSLVCDLDHITDFVRNTVIDEVVIGLPVASAYTQASRIAALCELQGIIVRFLTSLFTSKLARLRAEDFDGDSLLTLYTAPTDGWPVLAKRIWDLSLSLVLTVLLAPVFLAAAVLIKLTSQGPVLFMQERLGLNKRKFRIYKFRTMEVDAERKISALQHLNEVSGPAFKITNDPRVTGVGRLLRKTSIDELPQLFNVLEGDMSMVGPRPLPVRDYEGFGEDWHRRRFSVRPGITCLWQVSGRSSIGFDKWMELDMQYIDEWSLWLDLKILAGTIPAVLKGSGAA